MAVFASEKLFDGGGDIEGGDGIVLMCNGGVRLCAIVGELKGGVSDGTVFNNGGVLMPFPAGRVAPVVAAPSVIRFTTKNCCWPVELLTVGIRNSSLLRPGIVRGSVVRVLEIGCALAAFVGTVRSCGIGEDVSVLIRFAGGSIVPFGRSSSTVVPFGNFNGMLSSGFSKSKSSSSSSLSLLSSSSSFLKKY